jgi:hypothetical protein
LEVILDDTHAQKLYTILYQKYPEALRQPYKPQMNTTERIGNKAYHGIPAYICGILSYLQSKR